MKKTIKYLVMDVDGTLTDGKIYIGNEGEIFKAFSVKDGHGIYNMLPDAGIIPIIITGRKSRCLEIRCKELNITELYQGIKDKMSLMHEIVYSQGADYSNVAYIGDDLNDLDCMISVKEAGGAVGCPADAVELVKDIADFVCTKNGGDGAVREFIEWLVCEK